MDGQYVFEEIKQRYEKSNKYMLCVTYEDIGILIHIIEALDKQLKFRKEKEAEVKISRPFIAQWSDETKILLNLIEKQFKEIEILNKNMNLLREQNISYKQSIHGLKEMNKIINKNWEDKIKAKIEELKEDIKYSANPLSIDNSKFGIEVLQSLLKEDE